MPDEQKEDLTREERRQKIFDEIMDSGESKVRILPSLGGLLQRLGDDIFYQTVFAQKEGQYTPLVVTSWGNVFTVYWKKGKKEEQEKETDKTPTPESKKDESKPYQCIYFDGFEYRFRNKISFDACHRINTINNDGIKDLTEPGHLKYSKEDIYNPITQEIQAYYFHDNAYEYDIAFSSVIQSYIYQTIGGVFYLVLQGGPGSGKSVLLNLLAYLCLNGKRAGRTSIPASVRLIDLFGVTLCQDEIDKISKDDKEILVGVFNDGFNVTGSYTIADKEARDRYDQVVSFNTFCPKYFACNDLREFDDTMIDRCYILNSVKAGKPLKNIYQAKSSDFQRFQDVRNKTFSYCMQHWIELFEDIESVKETLMSTGVYGRDVDKYSIILGIIKHFKGGEYAGKVWTYIKDKIQTGSVEEQDVYEQVVLDLVVSVYGGQYSKTIEIVNKDLYTALLKRVGMNANEKGAPSNRTLRMILDHLGVLTKKSEVKYTETGSKKYVINTEKLRKILDRCNYITLSGRIPKPGMSRVEPKPITGDVNIDI